MHGTGRKQGVRWGGRARTSCLCHLGRVSTSWSGPLVPACGAAVGARAPLLVPPCWQAHWPVACTAAPALPAGLPTCLLARPASAAGGRERARLHTVQRPQEEAGEHMGQVLWLAGCQAWWAKRWGARDVRPARMSMKCRETPAATKRSLCLAGLSAITHACTPLLCRPRGRTEGQPAAGQSSNVVLPYSPEAGW